MVRSALVGALVAVMVVACARPNPTVQLPPPTPTPTPSPSPTPTAPLHASSAPFHVGEVGVGYAAVALSATGGVQPYTWSVSAGALPDGLTLGSDGSVSGTPSSAGSFAFTIQVADSGGSTATVSGKIGVAAHLSAGLIAACATQCWVELGCVNVCGAFGQVSGGVGPYSYTQTSGQLPAGTALSGLSLTGTFTGLSGYLQFTVEVTDSLGVTADVAPTFWMHQHITFAGGVVGANRSCSYNGCTQQLPWSGGGGVPTALITRFAWPPNGCYNPNGGPCTAPPQPTVAVSGSQLVFRVPSPGISWVSGYTATLTVVLTDQRPCSSSSNCSTTGTVTVIVQGG